MKFYLFIAVILSTVAIQKCHKLPSSSVPACIQEKIEAIKKEPRWNPPAEVNEYSYEGKRVFLFSSDCCDNFNQLFDEACNYICAPSGGFTGKGDRKCEDFKEKAEFVKLVWKDER